MTKLPMSAVKIAVRAVNASAPELSRAERVLYIAKAGGIFDGSIQSAILILNLNGFKVI